MSLIRSFKVKLNPAINLVRAAKDRIVAAAQVFRLFKVKLALALMLVGITIAVPNQHANDTFIEPLVEAWVFPIQGYIHYDDVAMDIVSCHIDKGHVSTDHVRHNDRFYSQKTPGMTWLGITPYWLLTQANGGEMPAITITAKYLAVVVVLPTLLLTLFFWGVWLRSRIGENWALLAVLITLTASPLYIYAGMFVDYAMGTSVVLVTFLLLQHDSKWRMALAGMVAGCGMLINYWVGVLCLILLGIEVLRQLRTNRERVHVISLYLLPTIIFLAAVDKMLAGLVLGYAGTLLVSVLLHNQVHARWSRTALWSLIGYSAPLVAFLSYNDYMWGDALTHSYDLLLPHAQALHDEMTLSFASVRESLFGWRRGMFMHAWWSPIAVVTLVITAIRSPKWRWFSITALCLTSSTILFQAYYTSTNSDVLPFSRHMVPVWPWLAVGVVLFLRWCSKQTGVVRGIGNGVIGGLVAISAFFPFAASWTYPMQTEFPPNQMANIWIQFFASGNHLPVTHWAQLFNRYDVPGMDGWRAMIHGGGNWTTISICAILIVSAYSLTQIKKRRKT